jgi:20S proteasome alpha/beta subunit
MRLSGRRKAVTVCIAAINTSNPWPMIIAASDRKLSMFGGWASSEGAVMKMSGLNKNWTVMFSGPVSAMSAMIDAMKQRTEKLKATDHRSFARLCRTVYREERQPLIESEILGDYDIDTYAEYVALRKSNPQLYSAITSKIQDMEHDWSLLFAGFDRKKQAHIFTISESGKIDFWDRGGYAAIGSGGWRSMLALSSFPFKQQLDLSQAIFGVAAAKFAAEAADGVGEETILTLLEANSESSPVFPDHAIPVLRRMWRELPRFPGQPATTEIWRHLSMFQQFGWLKNPQTKPIRRPIFQSSAPERQ